MAKEFMTTAKDLAWKAYSDNEYSIKGFLAKEEARERFELWWSDNYGNRDSTKFYSETSVFID